MDVTYLTRLTGDALQNIIKCVLTLTYCAVCRWILDNPAIKPVLSRRVVYIYITLFAPISNHEPAKIVVWKFSATKKLYIRAVSLLV